MGYSKFYFTSTEDIKRRHKGHWFSKETMRFFKSRVHEQVYHGDSLIYFVSSESIGPMSNERGYTVRSYCSRTDRVETVSEFNQYRSRSGAHSAAARLASQELQSSKPC